MVALLAPETIENHRLINGRRDFSWEMGKALSLAFRLCPFFPGLFFLAHNSCSPE